MNELIIGGPGTGLTSTLVEEANRAIQEHPEGRVVLIAQNKYGAGVFDRRIRGKALITTPGGLAWKLVREAHKSNGLAMPEVYPREEALRVMRAAASRIGSIEDPEWVLDICWARNAWQNPGALSPAWQVLFEQYTQILGEEAAIDRNGLMNRAIRLVGDPSTIDLKGAHLFVDQAEDLDALSLDLILKVGEGAEEMRLAGSPDQEIYGFLGADWNVVVERMQSCATRNLATSYRATSELLETMRKLAEAEYAGTHRGSGSRPTLVRCEDEADYIGATLQWWLADCPANQIAVLARTDGALAEIQKELRNRGIAYTLSGEDPFALEEVWALSGYLAIALNPGDPAPIESVINMPPSGLSTGARFELRGNRNATWADLERAGQGENGALAARAHELLQLRDTLHYVAEAALTCEEQVSEIARQCGIPEWLQGQGDWTTRRLLGKVMRESRHYDKLAHFCKNLARGVEQNRFARKVELSTIHAAKGKEWDAVIVAGFTRDQFGTREGRGEEELRRLACVAAGRAREQLLFTAQLNERPSQLAQRLDLPSIRYPEALDPIEVGAAPRKEEAWTN